jgi:cysteinyl-tRNA synthetase
MVEMLFPDKNILNAMPLQFFDTRHRRKVNFEPLTPGKVSLYTCGPTVYNDAHIGNFRTYMFEDLLRRTLKFLGFDVTQVMNITDIDDKTIRAAKSGGVALENVTAPIVERFFRDLDALRIERAEFYPRATAHIPEMIAIIGRLLDKGVAYQAEGNIYFSVEKFAGYGQLSGMNLEKLERGVRIDADEYEEKESFRDFALWKGWSEDDGDVWWDSPWGRGRPGWHIECSAMSMKHLGETFDIHTGGVDNIFPHHENEIAQSSAATGREFVRYWLHSAHLQVEGEKMSKSLGNFYTLRELIEKGYSARTIRYVLIGSHYRLRVNFSHETFSAAQNSLERLDTLRLVAEKAVSSRAERPGLPVRFELAQQLSKWSSEFKSALEDDLNIANAMAALFELVSAGNRLATATPFNQAEGEAILSAWRVFDRVLGFLFWDELPQGIIALIIERTTAKAAKEFARADAIRAELAAKGYTLKDGKDGVEVTWATGESSGSAWVERSAD